MSQPAAVLSSTAALVRAPESLATLVFKGLRRSRSTVIGGSIVLTVVLVAIFASVLSPHDPQAVNVMDRLQGPNATYPFGTDNLGRDTLSRVIYGARVSLVVGTLVVATAAGAGVIIGLASGYSDRLDRVLMRLMDGLMAFPSTLLAIALMATLGARLSNVIIALAIVFTPRVARVVRGVTLVLRELDYVQAAQALGAADSRILRRHILPNCLAPVIVQSTFIFAESVLAEAALSFLGVGLPPYIPSWGTIITTGRMFMQTAPWITIFPGLAILVTVLGLNLLGDGLRDLSDPRLRGRLA
ncbi:MAG: ABC transporter permease [Armatimonadota bacterium]|nr:ABC transporter permease [Armatimonadota bacterium]MDR7550373.1 ABC transporter permease [Armatimonadota bacterium]